MDIEELDKQTLNQLNTNIDKDVNVLSQIVGNKDYLKNLEMLKSINYFKDESSSQMKELLKLNGNLLFDNFKNLTKNYLEKFETYNEYVNLESKNSKYINVEKLIELKNLIKENYELNKYVFDENPNIDKKDFENTVNDIKNINELFNKIIIVQLSDLNIKDDVLSKLDENTKLGVSKNLNTPKEVLINLIKDDSWEVKRNVAKNPNTGEYALEVLAKDKDDLTRMSVASNPNTQVYLLKILSKDEDNKVKMCVAENPNTPINILEKLSKDEDCQVRECILNNPNITKEILTKLSQDDDMDVSEIAMEKLSTFDSKSRDTIDLVDSLNNVDESTSKNSHKHR